jgi:hypothetical protein
VRGAVPGCLPPVAMLQNVTAGAKPRILFCGVGRPLHKHPVVVQPATNTTATNETTSTGSASGSMTTTGPAITPTTVTTSATATSVTNTTTGSSTETNWQTTTSSSPAGPHGVKAPPILQACIAAARRARVDQDARTSPEPKG